jgi:septal ring factor EnvC (AmiA/AmiB activator)
MMAIVLQYEGAEMRIKSIALSVTVMGMVMLAGCAGSTPPVQDIKIAKMALIDAEEAKESPKAVDYFNRAQDALKAAQEKMAKKEYEAAKFLAQKATADARLAKIKAQNSQLEEQIDALEAELKKIREEFTTIDESGGER